MAGAISGIGQIRDPGDPYDRRRRIHSRPLSREVDDAMAREIYAKLIEVDPNTGARSMRLSDAELARQLPDLTKYGLPRERDVRPESKKELRTEGVDPESDFRLGQKIRDVATPEVAAYGGVQIPVMGPDGQVRDVKTVYSNAESYEEAESLGEIVKRLRREYVTPLTNEAELAKLEADEKFVRKAGPGTEIGYIIDGEDKKTGEVITRKVYKPKGDDMEGIYRVGNPQNRDYDAIRSDLKQLDPAFMRRVVPVRTNIDVNEARQLRETGLVPFLEDETINPKVGGIRSAYEGRPPKPRQDRRSAEMSRKYGMTFNDLLRDLEAGAFMGSPTVVNAYKELEKDPEIGRRIMSLKMAAERTTIPAKAAALSRAVANIEAGIAQVRAERTGKEVDIQSFVPDYDPAPGITDVAAEIAEMARGEEIEFDYDSAGERRAEKKRGNPGFREELIIERPPTPRDAVAMSGPVTVTNQGPEHVRAARVQGYAPAFSAAAAEAIRRKYRNPELAAVIRATSQPETDIPDPLTIYRETGMQPVDAASGMRQRANIAEFIRQNAVADRIQQAYDQRLALLGAEQQEKMAETSGTNFAAPAPPINTSREEQKMAVVDDPAMRQQIANLPNANLRQTLERGIRPGASAASIQGVRNLLRNIFG